MLESFRDLFAPPRHMLFLIAAFWIGQLLAEKRCEQRGLAREKFESLSLYTLGGFLVAGRLLFVLRNLSAFAGSPLNAFSINPDLFDPQGGLLGAGVVLLMAAQRLKLSPWSLLDAGTPLFAVLAVGFGFAHLADGSGFGIPSDLPWAMFLWNAPRHPTQVYEIITAILIAAFALRARRLIRPGMEYLEFMIFTSAARLFLEGFQADRVVLPGGFSQEQVAAWLVLAASLLVHEWKAGLRPPGRTEAAETGKRGGR